MQAGAQAKEAEMQLKDVLNQRDNETKVLVATISAGANQQQDDGIVEPEFSEEAKAKLKESMRQFDEKIKLDRERLSLDREKAKTDAELKRKALNKKPTNSTK